MHFRFVAWSLIFFCAVFSAEAARRSGAKIGTAYKGAIVVDATTGDVILEDHPDSVSPPASVTKLMTFLVVQDRIRAGSITLETPVTVTAEDAKIGGTQVWLKEREVFTVEELLYALLIQSANDAASALARTAGGSRQAFVEMMNARAAQLGMSHTTFRSPHGLPPNDRKITDSDLTSPRDLATLSRDLIQHTDILRYTSVKTRIFRPNSDHKVVMNNHNHLLGKVAGVDGLKTGFTDGAGFCLAATALRNGRRIIAVAMGSPDRKTRDLHVGELIERGFAALPPLPPGSTAVVPAPTKTANSESTSSPISAPPSSPTAEKPAEQSPPTITFPGVKRK